MWSKRGVSVLAIAVLMLAVVPTGEAQGQHPNVSTPTKLYFHIFDTFNPFPINTQPMNVSFFEVGGTSFPSVSQTPANDQLGDFDFNTIYGFSTSGPVEYDFIENGRPRYHPEPGIAQDVEIDSGVEPIVYLYIDVRDVFSSDTHPDNLSCIVYCVPEADDVVNPLLQQWQGAPQFLPKFTFDVELRSGNRIADDVDLNAGALIMEGSFTAHLVDTHALGANSAFPETAPDGTPILRADEAGVIEFPIRMTDGPKDVITKLSGFHVRIDWYQNPSDDEANNDKAAEGYVRLLTDPTHLPRLEMAIMNPIYIDFIHPQVSAGILLIHTGVNSPWGTYDVDVNKIQVKIKDESGSPVDVTLQQFVGQNAHVHGRHDQNAEVTYLWRFREDQAPDGNYSIEVKVPNLAGNANATGIGYFELQGKKAFGVSDQGEVVEPVDENSGQDRGSPGFAFLWTVAALGAATVILRRRGPPGKPVLAALLLCTMLLAGCSGGGGNGGGGADPTDGPLKAGKGAISGLLIDDRFRPIPGGTILLTPIGLTQTSDGNGEFAFTNLEPGAYLAAVQVEGHEAVPTNVEVAEDEYAELELMARRIVSEGGRIITQEYSIFMTCTMEAVVVAGNGLNCFFDLSGDSERTAFDTNLTMYSNITYMITEAKFNQVGGYDFVIAKDVDGDNFLDDYWAEGTIIDGNYIRVVNQARAVNTEHNVQDRNLKWDPTKTDFTTTVFPHGEFYNELNEAGLWGAGVDVGIRAKVIQSVFIGAPEVDINTYEVLAP